MTSEVVTSLRESRQAAAAGGGEWRSGFGSQSRRHGSWMTDVMGAGGALGRGRCPCLPVPGVRKEAGADRRVADATVQVMKASFSRSDTELLEHECGESSNVISTE